METNNINTPAEDLFKYDPEFEEKVRPAMQRLFAKKMPPEQLPLFFRICEKDEKIKSLINPILDIYRQIFKNIIKYEKQNYMKYRKINNHKKNKQKWNQNL